MDGEAGDRKLERSPSSLSVRDSRYQTLHAVRTQERSVCLLLIASLTDEKRGGHLPRGMRGQYPFSLLNAHA